MTAVIILAFETCGAMLADQVIPKKPCIQALIGLVLGILLMMWLPALVSFFMPFNVLSNLLALGIAAAITAASVFLFQSSSYALSEKDIANLNYCSRCRSFNIAFNIFAAYAYFAPVDGSFHVGQSTYGDLPLHLSIATSLKNKQLP